MSNFGSIFDVSVTGGMPAVGMPLDNPDPTQDYISSGPGRLTPKIPQLLPADFDDVTRNFGLRTYEAMLTDPAVNSSYLALKLSILNGPIQVMPAVKPKGYRYRPPGQRPPAGAKENTGESTGSERPSEAGSIDSGSTRKAGGVRGPSSPGDGAGNGSPGNGSDPAGDDAALAQEVAEFCERELERLRTPFKQTLLQMLDCMAFGNKLAEKTREVAEDGPDKGKLVLKTVSVKPAWSWKFVVNPFMAVTGILTFVPPMSIGGPLPDGSKATEAGGLVILPPEKFAIFTWMPRDSDPRGTSALRAAYDWWNLKQQLKPFYYAHMRRFGSPSLDGVLAQNDTATRATIDPKTGAETGKKSSPAQVFQQQLIAFQNNSVIVRPFGSELNVLEPKSDGEAFLKGFDLFDRQISLAIGLQVRASMEAKHGSKADSETAENTRGLVIGFGREAAGGWISREIFYDSVSLNYGKDVADRLTPQATFGQTEAQDRSAEWSSAASIGYTVGPSQLPEMDAQLGLPDRDVEADAAAAQEAFDQQQAAAGGQPGDGGEPSGSGGKPGDKGSKSGAVGPPGQRKPTVGSAKEGGK